MWGGLRGAPSDREQKGGEGVGVEKGYRGRPGAGSPVGSGDIGEENYDRNTDAGGLTRYERGRRAGLSARLGKSEYERNAHQNARSSRKFGATLSQNKEGVLQSLLVVWQ